MRTALHDGARPTRSPTTWRSAGRGTAGDYLRRRNGVSEGQAKTLFRRKATGLLPLFGRQPLDFTCTGKPALSVVMVAARPVCTDAAGAWLRCAATTPAQIELVLVDFGLDRRGALHRPLCARRERCCASTRISVSCAAAMRGLMFASAEAVLLLNNDVELAPGAVAAALDRLMSDRAIGAVGGKMIRTHGLLQEAGCIVWARWHLAPAICAMPRRWRRKPISCATWTTALACS